VGEELQPYESSGRPGSAWYSLGATDLHVGIVLALERTGESEIRGGRVMLLKTPWPTNSTVPAAWGQVMRFLDEGIVLAARSAGASIRVPTVEELFLSQLPRDVADSLVTFSKQSRKMLPLERTEAERWHSFVIGMHRTKTGIDPQEFVEWLSTEGWSRDSVEELSTRFFEDSLLLARYADEVSAA